jgi:hypothetical protein
MYTTPEIGTILPAQRNFSVVNPGPVQSAKGDALNEWLQAQAQDTAYQKNTVLVEDWAGIFANWLTNYQTGRLKGTTGIQGDPDAPPSQPPPAFVVVVIAAEAGGVTFDVQPSGQDGTGPYIPACDVPPYDKITAPQKPGSGKIKD